MLCYWDKLSTRFFSTLFNACRRRDGSDGSETIGREKKLCPSLLFSSVCLFISVNVYMSERFALESSTVDGHCCVKLVSWKGQQLCRLSLAFVSSQWHQHVLPVKSNSTYKVMEKETKKRCQLLSYIPSLPVATASLTNFSFAPNCKETRANRCEHHQDVYIDRIWGPLICQRVCLTYFSPFSLLMWKRKKEYETRHWSNGQFMHAHLICSARPLFPPYSLGRVIWYIHYYYLLFISFPRFQLVPQD